MGWKGGVKGEVEWERKGRGKLGEKGGGTGKRWEGRAEGLKQVNKNGLDA